MHHKHWLSHAARIGYAAKGVTYVLIAILAIQSAFVGSTPESTGGALQSVDGPAGGKLLLMMIAIGLAGYAVWKIYVTFENPEDKNLGLRATAFVVALTNGGFALQAAMLAFSMGGHGADNDLAVQWSALVMSHKAGVFAVGMAGVFAATYGIAQLVRVMRRKFDDHIPRMKMPSQTKRWVVAVCKFGIAARGVVFGLIGWFLIRAAVKSNPGEARDFGHSLNELRQQPLGRTMLLVVAVGLMAYALYQFVRARYQRFAS